MLYNAFNIFTVIRFSAIATDASGNSQQGAFQQYPVSAARAGSASRAVPSPHALLLRGQTPAPSTHPSPFPTDTHQIESWACSVPVWPPDGRTRQQSGRFGCAWHLSQTHYTCISVPRASPHAHTTATFSLHNNGVQKHTQTHTNALTRPCVSPTFACSASVVVIPVSSPGYLRSPGTGNPLTLAEWGLGGVIVTFCCVFVISRVVLGGTGRESPLCCALVPNMPVNYLGWPCVSAATMHHMR